MPTKSVHDPSRRRVLPSRLTAPCPSSPIETGRIDGDATVDLVVGYHNSGRLSYFSNTGAAVFTEHVISAAGVLGNPDFELVDLDFDGDLDIVAAGSSGGGVVSVFWNDVNGTTGAFSVDVLASDATYVDGVGYGDLDLGTVVRC